MKHRRKLAAVAVVAMGLIFVGLGARKDDDPGPVPGPEKCTTDLASVFAWCEKRPGCTHAPRAYKAACEAGCLMHFCPEQARCTGLDPIFCAPCTDPHSAVAWRLSGEAIDRCYDLGNAGYGSMGECMKADFKQHCPGWDGRWYDPDDIDDEEEE
jgi:hypothetical protein